MIQLKDSALAIALQRTTKPIHLRDLEGVRTATFEHGDDIAAYIIAGYEAHGTKHRVRYLRPPRLTPFVCPELPFEKCWLNTRASVIRFFGDQMTYGESA